MTNSKPKIDPVIKFYEKYPFPNEPSERWIHDRVIINERLCKKSDEQLKILVIGCGTGEEVISVRRVWSKATIVAIEPSKNSAAIARERTKEKIIIASIENYHDKERYDIIICQGVLHHTSDMTGNLRRITELLCDDGVILLSIYHHARWDAVNQSRNEAQYMDGNHHPREHTHSWRGITELAERAGLQIIKTGHRLPIPRRHIWMAAYDGLFQYFRQQSINIKLSIMNKKPYCDCEIQCKGVREHLLKIAPFKKEGENGI